MNKKPFYRSTYSSSPPDGSPPEEPELAPDGSPVKTAPPKGPDEPWKPKTVAEHNAWVDSLGETE